MLICILAPFCLFARLTASAINCQLCAQCSSTRLATRYHHAQSQIANRNRNRDHCRPGSTQVVPNEGMPLAKDAKQRGNLVLQFTIDFPDQLSVDQKNKLKAILP